MGYVDRMRAKYTAKWGVQMTGMNFQTRSNSLRSDRVHFRFNAKSGNLSASKSLQKSNIPDCHPIPCALHGWLYLALIKSFSVRSQTSFTIWDKDSAPPHLIKIQNLPISYITHSQQTALGSVKGGGGLGRGRAVTVCFAFAGILGVLKLLEFALKRKCILSERSEFMHFRFAFSKNQKF